MFNIVILLLSHSVSLDRCGYLIVSISDSCFLSYFEAINKTKEAVGFAMVNIGVRSARAMQRQTKGGSCFIYTKQDHKLGECGLKKSCVYCHQ